MKTRIFFKYFLVACICALTFLNCKKASDTTTVSLAGSYIGTWIYNGKTTSNFVASITGSTISIQGGTISLIHINEGVNQSTADLFEARIEGTLVVTSTGVCSFSGKDTGYPFSFNGKRQ